MSSTQAREGLAIALASMRPPPAQTVSQWADRNRFLTEGTADPGRWVSRPYQVPVMDSLDDPESDGTIAVMCSQGGGKTEMALNVCGYHADYDPASILVSEPNLEMATAFSKDRLAPMIRDTPSLAAKFSDPKSRDSDNTVRHKKFPAGHVTIVGAHSASGLAMRPIRVYVGDEIDRYPPSAGTEGDPLTLAVTRTVSFWNAVKFYVTSPGIKEVSRSWKLWMRSDQNEWFVPCPDCGHDQTMKWSQVHWDKDEFGSHLPQTAKYACERCGSLWDDGDRWRATREGEYRPQQEFEAGMLHGFRFPALAVMGRELAPIVRQWLEAQGNPELLKVFINTVLSEWWEEEGAGVDEHALMTRARDEAWDPAPDTVPQDVVLITVGVDVQDDRLEYEVVGWSESEESWSLHYGLVPGNIKQVRSVEDDLDRVLLRPWKHPGGGTLYAQAVGMDTGYATQTIYQFCKPRFRRVLPNGLSQFVFALKGRSEKGRPVWPDRASRKGRLATVNLWVIGVDAAKEQVYGRLGIVERGPGYSHFPAGRPQGYYEQLTSEHALTRYAGGIPYRAFELKQKGRPNEALDCRVYSYAAQVGIQSAPFSFDWKRAQARLEAPTPQDAAQRPNRRSRVRSRGVEA